MTGQRSPGSTSTQSPTPSSVRATALQAILRTLR